ncbi:CBS domain-containing protein [Chloroflexota bacterium]
MRVRDIMTKDVITIPSSTTIAEADDILSAKKINRLPVVDDGKLVGIVSRSAILKATAPKNTPIAVWKLPHFFFRMKVKEVMIKDVVTVTPDMTVEGAAFIAQENKVGGTPVLEGDRLVGMVTSNDYYYNILNPLLGVKSKGQRVIIKEPNGAVALQEIFGCIAKYDIRVKAVSYLNLKRKGIESHITVSLDTEDSTQVAAELRDLGYDLEIR